MFCPFLPRRPRRYVADGKLKGMDYLLATQDHYTVETYFLDCLHAAAHVCTYDHAMYLSATLCCRSLPADVRRSSLHVTLPTAVSPQSSNYGCGVMHAML